MIRLPSLQRPYDYIYSGDPALKKPPAEPASGATDEDVSEYRKTLAEYNAALTAARDTGKWDAMLIEGEVPLKFVLGHVDRTAFRAIADRCRLPDTSPQHIGDAQLAVLLARLAIHDVIGSDLKITRSPDSDWNGWVMCQQDAIDRLDLADYRIVNEIGAHVWLKALDIGPKRSRE